MMGECERMKMGGEGMFRRAAECVKMRREA